MHLAETLFSTPEMAAAFSGTSQLRGMLAFEAALARAEARAGVIPAAAADAISAACRVENLDVAAVYQEAVSAGTPAIPLARRLTALVPGDGRRFVHWGATSQDVMDTALVLQMRDGLDLLEGGLLALAAACAALAERHRHTPMAGRTLLQQAVPVTFGLKAARWLAATTRQVTALRELHARVLVVQLGGAAGTLASLGDQGVRVAELLAGELGLGIPELPWHTERDRVAEVAGALGILAGSMGKIAMDLALLAQTEVGEVSEGGGPGKGGSSTLPQKRNPVDAVEAVAAARLAIGLVPVVLGAMVQEHERAIGGWQAEWSAMPDLFRCAGGAVERVRSSVAGLEVHPDRMRANLDQTGGLIMAEALSGALARRLGRQRAHDHVQALSRRATAAGTDLRQAAVADERVRSALSVDAIDQALDPSRYLGSTDVFIDRALAGLAALPARRAAQEPRRDR